MLLFHIYVVLKMARKQYSPQERLGDFILNKEASQSNVEILRNFLNGFEPIQRKRIINAPLTQYFSRTSVHLAAEKGLTPFLLILLKHGGEILMTNKFMHASCSNYYTSNSSQGCLGKLPTNVGFSFVADYIIESSFQFVYVLLTCHI